MSDLNIKEIRIKLGITQKKLAELVGVSEKTVQNWEYGNVVPKSKHPILRSLILDKKEELLTLNQIPLIPTYVRGGKFDDFTTQVSKYDCEKVISPLKHAEFAITVYGDSMAPEFESGSQVHIMKVNEEAFLEWGKVYVLDTCNGTVLKKIFKTDKENVIRCSSINKEYEDFEVNTQDIYGFYRVLACLTFK